MLGPVQLLLQFQPTTDSRNHTRKRENGYLQKKMEGISSALCRACRTGSVQPETVAGIRGWPCVCVPAALCPTHIASGKTAIHVGVGRLRYASAAMAHWHTRMEVTSAEKAHERSRI